MADYFLQMRKIGKYIAPDDKIVHVQEMLSLMSALTNDGRFADIYNEVKGKERVSMCTVLDEIEEKGIKKGMKQGMEKGMEKGRDAVLISLVRDGILDICIAADRANMSVEEFESLMENLPGRKV